MYQHDIDIGFTNVSKNIDSLGDIGLRNNNFKMGHPVLLLLLYYYNDKLSTLKRKKCSQCLLLQALLTDVLLITILLDLPPTRSI